MYISTTALWKCGQSRVYMHLLSPVGRQAGKVPTRPDGLSR